MSFDGEIEKANAYLRGALAVGGDAELDEAKERLEKVFLADLHSYARMRWGVAAEDIDLKIDLVHVHADDSVSCTGKVFLGEKYAGSCAGIKKYGWTHRLRYHLRENLTDMMADKLLQDL